MTEEYSYCYPTGGRYYTAIGPYYEHVDRPDQEIEIDVRRMLEDDSWVNANDVQVQVKSGTVTLSGTVHSMTEKRAAGDDAWDMLGVRNVYNNLDIREMPR